jgi:hypothetical protein
MIIPIGVDCGNANLLKEHSLRSFSFPFDWVVTYNGVSKCFDDNFLNFIPTDLTTRINEYNMYFMHDFAKETFDIDKIKYTKRIKRLINILENIDEEIIFLRKGHSIHHHDEHNGRFTNIKNDIDDAKDLETVFSKKYKYLNYKIIVILICGKCFDSTKVYDSHSDKIDVYNIITTTIKISEINDKFEECLCNIFVD